MEVWPLGLSDDEKRELALALNEHRQHLTAEDRKELAKKLREEGKSYREIGEVLGVSHEAVRQDVSGVKELTPESITGRDGEIYPAMKPPRVHIESPEEVDGRVRHP